MRLAHRQAAEIVRLARQITGLPDDAPKPGAGETAPGRKKPRRGGVFANWGLSPIIHNRRQDQSLACQSTETGNA